MIFLYMNANNDGNIVLLKIKETMLIHIFFFWMSASCDIHINIYVYDLYRDRPHRQVVNRNFISVYCKIDL